MSIQDVNQDTKLGDIVIAFPEAADVFKQYGIDFCCNGNRPLSEAAKAHGLNETDILFKIIQAYASLSGTSKAGPDWRNASYRELVEHITTKHHDYLKKELPLLNEYVSRIANVHGQRHGDVLYKLETLYSTIRAEMEEHMQKEEAGVFPDIIGFEEESSQPRLKQALAMIDELEKDHEAAGDILRKIREITSDFTLPEDACSTYALTYRKLETLEDDMFQHVHLENNILFPRLQAEVQ